MEKSQIWLIVGAIIVVSALILRIGSPTNRWVCEHGAWVSKGNPSSAQPTKICVDDLSIDAELKVLTNMLDEHNSISRDEMDMDSLLISASSSVELLPTVNVDPRQAVTDDVAIINSNISKSNSIKIENEVILISPQVDEVVHNHDIITGQARGTWFFEGNLPLLIKDASGEILATGFVEAQDNWMTSEWVPFQGTLNFNVATSTLGELVFKKNNPSVSLENEVQVSCPVRLEP